MSFVPGLSIGQLDHFMETYLASSRQDGTIVKYVSQSKLDDGEGTSSFLHFSVVRGCDHTKQSMFAHVSLGHS